MLRLFLSQYSVIETPATSSIDEVRSSRLRRSGVEDLGDTGMVHQGQRLSLGLEASDHLVGIHAQFDDLESHLAADGLLLLGHVDHRHAAFADLLQELVPPDDRAWLLGNRGLLRNEVWAQHGGFEEIVHLRRQLEQRFDFFRVQLPFYVLFMRSGAVVGRFPRTPSRGPIWHSSGS